MTAETNNPDPPDVHPTQPTFDEAREHAFKALDQRPKFSIKMQIYFSFLLAFVIIFGIVTTQLINIYDMEDQIHYLEISDSYLFHVQQVRRFEKNLLSSIQSLRLGDPMDPETHVGPVISREKQRMLRDLVREASLHVKGFDIEIPVQLNPSARFNPRPNLNDIFTSRHC